jgi:hypothetical protein
MPPFTDPGVQGLSFLVMDPGEPMINDLQRGAIRGLGLLARQGNVEAQAALVRVARRPDLHPILREMSLLEIALPVPRVPGTRPLSPP